MARVVKVNYKYNTVDVVTTLNKNSTIKNPNDNGKFSARLPVSFGGKTPEGKPYGTNTLVTVGSLVLIGFLEGNKDYPIVLNIYGDTDNQSMLTRTTYTSADESDEALQRELWQLFTLYPSMTFKNIDGNGNTEISFSGKSFLYITDTDQDNAYVQDGGFDYQDLPSSKYANGDLIEPKSPNAPTVLYVHQGVYNNHRVTFFIKSDGTVRLGSRNVNGEGITFMEMCTDGTFRIVQKADSLDPEENSEKFSQIGIEENGNILLKSQEHKLEITNDDILIDGLPLSAIGGGGTEEMQGIKADVAGLTKSLKDIGATVSQFEGVIDGTFEDGIIQQAEAQAIAKYINTLNTEEAQLTAKFNELYSNDSLADLNKQDLKAKKADYDSKFQALMDAINTAITDGKTTAEEKEAVDTAFDAYKDAAAALQVAFEAASSSIVLRVGDDARGYTDTQISVISGEISLKVDKETYTDYTQQTSETINDLTKGLADTNDRVNKIAENVTYRAEILTTNGNIFKNGNINTVLFCKLYQGSTDITDQIDASRFIWTRISDDADGDEVWNAEHAAGTKSVTVTKDDVSVRATFQCDVLADDSTTV